MPYRILDTKFSPYLEKSILEISNRQDACLIYRHSGYLAGEDFTYQFLDLEDDFYTFFKKAFSKIREFTSISWNVWGIKIEPNFFEIELEDLFNCRASLSQKRGVQCEFMLGFLKAIVENYANRTFTAEIYCKNQGKNISPTHKGKCICRLIAYEI